jgi:hypothetical protein
MELPDNNKLLASTVAFLVDGQEEEAAAMLLASSLDAYESGDTWFVGNELQYGVHIGLSGPRLVYEMICDDKHPVTKAILHAMSAVLPPDAYISKFSANAELVDTSPEWRSAFLEILQGRGISNQGKDFHNQAVKDSLRSWNDLRFRSESEVRIAKALDDVGVLFLPNCMARLNTTDGRRNREADFLVCSAGKWGILEVDGEPFHPPTRTVEDHRRDRYFKAHGITVVEHFDATECYNKPDQVVQRFLEILESGKMMRI